MDMEVAFLIKEAVKKVRQNEEECHEIANCVALNGGLLKLLQDETDITKHEVMRNALKDVEKSFDEALKLVKKCQKRHISGAGDMANDLSRVQGDIGRKVQQVIFAYNIQGTRIVTRIQDAMVAVPLYAIAPVSMRSFSLASLGPEQEAVEDFTRFNLSQLKEVTENFCRESIIGKGGFAEIYKAELPNEQGVAIKKFFNSTSDLEGDMLCCEFNICRKLHHKNVVNLVGYCIDVEVTIIERHGRCVPAEEWQKFLVVGHVPNGSLKEIVEGTRHIDWKSCFQIIQAIALGVQYLHEQRVIHLDLKPANILLELDMNPVIIDFGVSKILDRWAGEIRLNDLAGTPGYMAPEHFSSRVSRKSDVFTFGITLLQTVISVCTRSERRPWYGREKWDEMLREAGGLKGLLHPEVGVDESQLKEIERSVEIGLLCTESEPADRPAMADVVQMLSGEKELPVPTNNPSAKGKA